MDRRFDVPSESSPAWGCLRPSGVSDLQGPECRGEAWGEAAVAEDRGNRQVYLTYYTVHLENLPAAQRRALSLVETQGASYDDVAACMDRSREDVRKLVSAGRQQICAAIRGSMELIALSAG